MSGPTVAETIQQAVAHHQAGRLGQAEALYRQILASDPGCADAVHLLGVIAHQVGKPAVAAELIGRAIRLGPASAAMFSNLGEALVRLHRIDEATGCFQRALALDPGLANAHSNLGNVRKDQGRPDEAQACYRQALALQPDRPDFHSNLVRVLDHSPGVGAAQVADELRLWNERHVRPLASARRPHPHDRSPARRLRIGYVSPDFRDHAVGLNLLPLFRHHDHGSFEWFGYSQTLAPDPITVRLRASLDQWRNVASLGPDRLAALVRADHIDILVDLALHTSKDLVAFAQQPAPVQVSFAGYPGGTGMETIAYHLTDPYLEPANAGAEPRFDAPFPLPETFWCYDPAAGDPAVNSLPALGTNQVTFGCLNAFCKVNCAVLELWARVMRAVPSSRLLLLCAEGSQREEASAFLGSHGVDPSRVAYAGRQPRANYLALYHQTDLSLDTFPYNGHTTSLDSYWMGVPVVTLVGSTPVGRAGWSQLSNLGLTELAAHTEDEFVRIAVELATDLLRLAALRATLRERMQQSPLMDAPRFARAIEDAYRTMWRRWCDRPA